MAGLVGIDGLDDGPATEDDRVVLVVAEAWWQGGQCCPAVCLRNYPN